MKKNKPVLVAGICTTMERLRMAIEVLTGKRTCFVCLDLNTCRGRVRIEDTEIKLAWNHFHHNSIEIWLADLERTDYRFYVARFSPDQKKVSVEDQNDKMLKAFEKSVGSSTGLITSWVGSSAADRRPED